jgi:hypothetical protein
MDLGLLSGKDHFFITSIWLTIFDVFGDRPCKEQGILQYDPNF